MRVRRVVIGLIAGLIVGSILGGLPGDFASGVLAVLTPVGQLWVNAIRMTVVPLVVSLMFVSIASRDTERGLRRVGVVTLISFVGILCLAAVFALLVAPPLIRDMKLLPDAAEALRATAVRTGGQTTTAVGQLPGFAAWLTGLVPANVVKSATDGAMLPLILFTFLFGLAARQIEGTLRAALVSFFSAVSGAMTRIVEWIILVAPIGIFALVVVAANQAGIALAGAMVYYVMAISAALVLFALLIYPITTFVSQVSLRLFVRAVAPAQAVALSSSSSLASLPALVEGSRKLGLPSQIGGFVLPLAVATFKAATPITWLMGTAFLARLYGVSLDTTALVSIALTAIVLSLTTPGVPQGAQLMLATVLTNFGIPAEGIALLIAADTIPDLFGTMANVTADLVAGTVVARHGVAESESEASVEAEFAEVES